MGVASLILRANASEEIGAGHVMRLIALAQGARREGCEAHFVLGGDPDFCAPKVVDAGFSITACGEPAGSASDSKAMQRIAHDRDAIAVVVDGYDFKAPYVASLAKSWRTVVIDDLANGHIPAHLVVNPNYGAEHLAYSVPTGTRVLAGSNFALLRSEFVGSPRPTRSVAEKPRLVLTFGGSDPVNATTRMVRVLGTLQDPPPIRIIIGAGFREAGELSACIEASGLLVEVVRDPSDMAACLSWGNLAISAAGGTLWELSYLRLAVATFSIVDNQEETARSLAERRMVFGGQRLEGLSDSELAVVLEKFLHDADTRDAYAARYHTLIDGLGAQRVVGEILST